MLSENNKIIAVIGLGYVGLPLAIEFGKKRKVFAYDTNSVRVEELKNNFDRTNEISNNDIQNCKYIEFVENIDILKAAKIFIITVPTPITNSNDPDMTSLKEASKSVGSVLKSGDIVIYESTVFPGTTEEICVPILEKTSKLKFNTDFYCGYSPERINPGDKNIGITDIVKLTSGSNENIADEIDNLYASIISAGTYKVSSIKIAEAAKVIENVQRDINIALMNELSIIFDKLDIDTLDVLKAAGTKWNFLKFKPGLVGGHCIGVDPYYLAKKAQEVGVNPNLILTSRSINDNMSKFIIDYIIKEMTIRELKIKGGKVLVLGLTFKENCPDLRNSKVRDIVKSLETYEMSVDIHDPYALSEEILKEFGKVGLKKLPHNEIYDAVIVAVAHDYYNTVDLSYLKSISHRNAVFFDIMGKIKFSKKIKRL